MKVLSIGSSARVVMRMFVAVAFLLSAPALMVAQTTNVQVTGAVQQANVSRLGINLGDQSYWDSGQLLKNLVWRNPGFEGMMYRSILKCSAVTATTCMDDNQYSRQQTGFWTGGTYLILSGNSAGKTGTVAMSTQNTSGCSGCGQYITFDQSINAAVGDYFVVTNSFPGNGNAGWWNSTKGGATITTELNDLSPETPGKQALVLTASGSGQLASVSSYFDSYSQHSFIQLNGAFQVTFRAKAIGGNNKLYVNVQRSMAGLSPYLSQTLTLTNTWQDYTLNFTASETGSAVGTVGLTLQASGSNVELDDVSLQQTNSSTSNPTVFRDDVVNALKELQPGTIRMMAAGAALGSDVINQLQVPYARYREGFNSSATEEDDVAYGIHEFLQLCAEVGADPWITIPTATTPQEMTALTEYLTGNGSDIYSALRIARGQAAPWTTVFNKIHIELGNETWNGDFKGESMGYPAYPQWANQVFGAARAVSGFQASSFDLVLNGWSSDPGYTQIELQYSTQHDSVDIAPYLLYSLNNESQALQFGAMFAEPEIWSSPGGIVYRNIGYGQTAARKANVNVYEVNLGSILGAPTEAQLNATQPSVGAGIAHADHMLQMMRIGVKYQNAFSLPQFGFLRGDGKTVPLWGMVIDMGTTNRRRPQFLTQSLANSAIGGTMLQTVQTGLNPTWNQPLSSDKVQLANAHEIQSFAFSNNGNNSVILFNLSQTTARTITLSGANAPTGSVQMGQVTSANITDNNETSNTVQTVSQTLSGFNPSAGLTLPPFSMTVLTSNSGAVQPPTFSVPAGTYTSAQTLTISDPTAGATVYYTTDGSEPTAASNAYAGSVTVSASETLQAIAVVTGSAPSGVATAAYVISQGSTAAPVFSVAAGSYTSTQTVSIADTTAGATVNYTIDGSVPTTSSPVYVGPITIAATETLNAVATATGYTQSAITSASYVIAKPAAVAPVFTVPGGSYSAAQTVGIVETTTGATVYYTTDGSVPTTASALYTGPITVSASETLDAIATVTGYTQSTVASASYVIAKPVSMAPVFTVPGGSYSATQTVGIVDTTAGATVYYTTDGSIPTTASAVYTGLITVSASETLNAIATAIGYTQSALVSASYVIAKPVATAPFFSVAGGTYAASQIVAIADATPGAVLYYTTDGSVPTTGSAVYGGPITVASTETLNAIAVASGYKQSASSSAAYVISKVGIAPVFSVAGGSYNATQTVSIADAAPGAVIYYSTDGSTPTTNSKVNAGPFSVAQSVVIKAMATAPGYSPSAVSVASYVITQTAAAAPVFSVASGTYPIAQQLVIVAPTQGSTVYYTTNGSTPTASSTTYTGPVTISSNTTFHAIAMAKGFACSSVASAAYVIRKPTVATPQISVGSGHYTAAQTVTIVDSTSTARIYYTTDGSKPTTNSKLYTGPLTVTASETLNAVGMASGYWQSPVASTSYVIDQSTAAAPVFSVASSTYSEPQVVTVTDATAGATIYISINGAKPTVYTGAITVSATEIIQAAAYAPKYKVSPIVAASYVIESVAAAAPEFSIQPGTYDTPQIVELKSGTSGAQVYYTTNGETPTEKSLKYTGPIKVGENIIIKAVAIATKHKPSTVAVANYSIAKLMPTAEPTFSVKPGAYETDQTVAIADATKGAEILVSVDGSELKKYTEPIRITKTTTLKAVAEAAKYSTSKPAEAIYVIKPAEKAKPTLRPFRLSPASTPRHNLLCLRMRARAPRS